MFRCYIVYRFHEEDSHKSLDGIDVVIRRMSVCNIFIIDILTSSISQHILEILKLRCVLTCQFLVNLLKF